jgi:hypothetical protein
LGLFHTPDCRSHFPGKRYGLQNMREGGGQAAANNPKQPERSVVSRLRRAGERMQENDHCASSTPSERTADIWELAQQRLAWSRMGGEAQRATSLRRACCARGVEPPATGK